MKIEVLASVMNKSNHDILKQMNLKTDAIIINQSNCFNYEEIMYNNNNIRFISFNEKGVGLSRNNALMRSNADIVVFADEDETFVDDYEKIIKYEFL